MRRFNQQPASQQSIRYVVIGNGVAGMEAAMSLRKQAPNASIYIVSEESEHFFARTALMWVLSGQLSYAATEPLERDAYAHFGFVRVRDRVVHIDTKNQTILLAGGEPVHYDKLLIACGSKPRPAPWPGAAAQGVGHFVTLQDLEWLEHELHGGCSRGGPPPKMDALDDVPREGSPYVRRRLRSRDTTRARLRPSVIGGGLIGIEAIECFVAAGLEPHFFIREEWFWPMALNRAEATWIQTRLEQHGVHVHLGHNVQALDERDGTLHAVVTDRGSFETNLCVVAVGVVPNTAWLAGSEIERDEQGGVVVNAHFRTSAPNVFAAGDCASVKWKDGRVAPEPLWYAARDQGRIAAQNMLENLTRYERGVWYNSAKLMDIEYTTVGELDADDTEAFFFEERGSVRSTTRIECREGRVVGFNLMGRRWDHNILIAWIDEARHLDWVKAHLRDASFDTEFVPPLRLTSES